MKVIHRVGSAVSSKTASPPLGAPTSACRAVSSRHSIATAEASAKEDAGEFRQDPLSEIHASSPDATALLTPSASQRLISLNHFSDLGNPSAIGRTIRSLHPTDKEG